MQDNAQAMLLASFAADALALGAHWIYDPQKIRDDFGSIRTYQQPPPTSYHASKNKGDFTHYGDQALLLLRCLADKKSFSLDEFAAQWQPFMAGYGGYMDKASRQTLANFRSGAGPETAGSSSSDLAGAARVAPLIYAYREKPEQDLLNAVMAQTRMTHNNPLVIESAVFFARTALAVLRGTNPVVAMNHLATTHFSNSPLAQWVTRAIETKDADSVKTIASLGQSCQMQDAFPGVIHLVARHEHDLVKGLSQCVMAGGDSAGRGMIVGLLLGAHQGMDAIPAAWLENMRAYPTIRHFMDGL
jgi:ADP-ribosylglycohydrolase